jgi:lysophospholipase L1-like esterase
MRTTTTLFAAGALIASLAAAQADFTRYVAIGDSITAGFASSSLNATYQANSYPAILHRQATNGAAGFEQPTVSEPGIPPILQLQSLVGPVIAPKPGLGQPTNLTLPRPYNNLAVPGAKIDDAINRISDGGGLHDLILRGIGTQLVQAVGLQPTFATVWIGNNDALAAATSGLVIEGVTLTSAGAFETRFRSLVGTLRSATSARLALATIPNVTTIPFVTTVPAVIINPATNQPLLINGAPVPLLGPNGPLQPGRDFVLLTATTFLRQGYGIPVTLGGNGLPLPDNAVLSASEAATIAARVSAFNSVIRAVAQETGSALVDVQAEFDEIASHGLDMGGIRIDARFLSGGLFSYDGVHPNAFGYAYLASRFIAAINDRFDADIPQVDLGPFLFGNDAAGPIVGPAVTADLKFTETAYDNLRWALAIPKTERLMEIKRRREAEQRPEGPTGGGGGVFEH